MNKCLCPCPDYIKVPLPRGMAETIIVDWPSVEFLHGKKADRECERCGTPLCGDCEAKSVSIDAIPFKDLYKPSLTYCPACS